MRPLACWPLAALLALAACGEAAVEPAAENQAATADQAGPPAPSANQAAAHGFPALAGQVVDAGDLLSPSEEARLTAELAALEQRTSDQLVVVTVPSLEGRTIEAYALALGNHWGIGQRGKDNGVLLVIAPVEGELRIEVGYGLEPILTDERARQIVERDMVPALRRGAWYEAISSGTREIAGTLVAQADRPRRGRS